MVKNSYKNKCQNCLATILLGEKGTYNFGEVKWNFQGTVAYMKAFFMRNLYARYRIFVRESPPFSEYLITSGLNIQLW